MRVIIKYIWTYYSVWPSEPPLYDENRTNIPAGWVISESTACCYNAFKLETDPNIQFLKSIQNSNDEGCWLFGAVSAMETAIKD